MFMHNKRLMYTVRVSEPNPMLASLMLEQFGGPQGELAAAMRYFTQAVTDGGQVVAKTSVPGSDEILTAQLRLSRHGSLPLDRWLAPVCTGITAMATGWLIVADLRKRRNRPESKDA